MDADKTVTGFFSAPFTSFYTVAPCRVFDSRRWGEWGPLWFGASRTIQVAPYGEIPATAVAVSLNVTVVSPTAPGHLRLYASGAPRPGTSVINYGPGQTRASNAVVSVGTDGAIVVYIGQATGTTHVVIDISGYFQ